MRQSTDLKESLLSKSTESSGQQPPHPKDWGKTDHHTLSETGQHLSPTANPNPVPKGQAEESGHSQTLSGHS